MWSQASIDLTHTQFSLLHKHRHVCTRTLTLKQQLYLSFPQFPPLDNDWTPSKKINVQFYRADVNFSLGLGQKKNIPLFLVCVGKQNENDDNKETINTSSEIVSWLLFPLSWNCQQYVVSDSPRKMSFHHMCVVSFMNVATYWEAPKMCLMHHLQSHDLLMCTSI